MISGATRGAGGRALGDHLADAKQLNEITELGLSRGLVGATIREQIAELTDLSSHSRAAQPLYHLHADPPPGAAWNESTWQRYWSLTEKEFYLERAAFSEERHLKDGKEHRHRVYNLVRLDGTTNPMAHDFQRREKLSRIMEFETEAPLTPGAHNRAVLTALDREGRPDVAAAMREAGLDTMERPRAAITPKQRAQSERTGVDPKTIGATVLTAWRVSDDAAAFRTALAEQGIRLAQGDRAAVAVDATGNVHPLARMLGRESKADGGYRIAAGDVTARLAGVDLPRHIPGADGEPVPALATVETPPAPVTSPATMEPAVPEASVITTAAQSEPAPEAVQPPPAGRQARSPGGSDRAASSGGGGGGGGGGSDPFASISPLDLSKPNDWLRFLNQTANAQNAKLKAEAAAEAARTISNGGNYAAPKPDHNQSSLADAITDAIQRSREIRAGRAASAAASSDEPNLDRRGLARDRSADSEGPSRAAAGDGPPGAVADRLRGLPGRSDLGSAPSPPRPPGAAAGEGNEPVGPDHRAPRASRGEPDQNGAEAGRTRIAARRTSLGLAAAVEARGARLDALTRALASPPTAAGIQTDRARTAMAASRARVAAVLETAPWPDPADRDRSRLQDVARDRLKETMAARAAAAAAAVEQAEQLRSRVGLVARALAMVGLETPAFHKAAEAIREAKQAERRAKDSRVDYREGLAQADRNGSAQAERRQRDQERWEDRPDVRTAHREEMENKMVAAAVRSGDPEIKEALAQEDGLRIARELLARREAERLAEVQRQQLHDQRTAATALRPGPAMPPGPRQ